MPFASIRNPIILQQKAMDAERHLTESSTHMSSGPENNPIQNARQVRRREDKMQRFKIRLINGPGTEGSNLLPSSAESVSAVNRRRCRPNARLLRQSVGGLGHEKGRAALGHFSLTGIDAVPPRESSDRLR